MTLVTPTRYSSSTAMAVEGQPMPVEVAVMWRPLYQPVIVRCSRLWATSRTSVRNSATNGTRNGSPGSSATEETSPGAMPMWYCRSVRPTWDLSTVDMGVLLRML